MDAGAKFNFMNQIHVNEVGPRDGLQNIDTILNSMWNIYKEF